MATEQTGPLDAGHTTSEFGLSKTVVVLSSVISVMGTVLSVLSAVTAVLPPAAGAVGVYLAIGGAAVAGLKAVTYEVQRAVIKMAAIKAGQVPGPDAPAPDAAAAELGAVK